MFLLLFSDDSLIVDRDRFFDVINFFDSIFYVTAILNSNDSSIGYYVCNRSDFEFVDVDEFLQSDCLWSLIGYCSDPDEVSRFKT